MTTAASLHVNSTMGTLQPSAPTLTLQQLQAEASRARSAIILAQEATRPKTSKRIYEGKQKDFIEWCSEKKYPDALVNEDKMIHFLIDMKDRKKKKPGRKRKSHNISQSGASTDTNNAVDALNTDSSEPLVGLNTHQAYATSIMNLWNKQWAASRNGPCPKRPYEIKIHLQNIQKEKVTRELASFFDRGIGTLAEVNTYAMNRDKMALFFWQKNSELGLKMMTDFLLSFALLCRGDNTRALKLSETGMFFDSDEGVEGAAVFRTVWRKSKKNQFGYDEENVCLRHVDVTQCPIGAIGFYFFYRWRIREDVPFPDFSLPKLWYNYYFLSDESDPFLPSTYPDAYSNYKKAQISLGIHTRIKTQGGRKHSSSLALNKGAHAPNVDQAGHWNGNARSGAYTAKVIPWDVARSLAGAPTSEGHYVITRNAMKPPASLVSQVFPLLPTAKRQVAEEKVALKRSEIAGDSFLQLLDHLSYIILQDAAMLTDLDDYKSHKIFNHPLFLSEEFKLYANQLREVVSTKVVADGSLLIERALPHVATSLRAIQQSSSTNTERTFHLEEKLCNLDGKVDQLVTIIPVVSTLFTAAGSALSSTSFPHPSLMSYNVNATNNISTSTSVAISSSSLTSTSVAVSSSSAAPPSLTMLTVFRMSRNINSVRDAWQEYKESILPLEQAHVKWSTNEAERKFYNRRKSLWLFIAKMGDEVDTSISFLEELLKSQYKSSLRSLCDGLAKHMAQWDKSDKSSSLVNFIRNSINH
jgi:hypothetical protein